MTDQDRWLRAVDAISADYEALSPQLRRDVNEVATAIRQAKRRLHRISEEMEGPSICASCGGECCRRGKYHVTVTDILVFLSEGIPLFDPRFDADQCPYLAEDGCMMEPSLRPFPCITFNCERVEGLWEPPVVETFYRGERELRTLYGRMEQLLSQHRGKGGRMAVLGYVDD